MGEKEKRRVDKLWQRGGPTWETLHIKNTEKGPLVWEARVSPFFQSQNNLPAEEEKLIVARNVITGEVKYFLTNAPADMPITILLHVAFSRWTIERIFQDAKGLVGLDHFEVRNYRPVMRHMILSMVSFLFLMKETHRLWEKKSMVEPMPSQVGYRSTA